METLPQTTDLYEAAAGYARLGLPIIPLRGKVPAVRSWQRFFATKISLRVWFGVRGCNVGLRTGESGYVVIDTDTPEAEAWAQARCTATPLVARSGGGSVHRYYATPPGTEIRNRQGLHRIPGLDVRGQGGFIVLPPSVHPTTGKRYEWVSGFRLGAVLPAFSPAWVHDRVRHRVRAVVCGDPGGMIRRARAYLARVQPAVSGQGGHNRTFRAACILTHKFALTFEEAWPLLAEWNEACLPPWSEQELRHKLEDALKAARSVGAAGQGTGSRG